MTWQAFLNAFQNPSLRDLPWVYVVVGVLQGGYLAWKLREWTRLRDPR